MISQSTLFLMWCSHCHSPCPCCTSLYTYLHWISFIVLLCCLSLLCSFSLLHIWRKNWHWREKATALGFKTRKCRTEWGWRATPRCSAPGCRDSACHTNNATQQLLRVSLKHSSANSNHKQLARLTRGDRKAEQSCLNVKIYQECHPRNADRRER